MTVIAWDGETLAADKMRSDGRLKWKCKKLIRRRDRLIARAGDVCEIDELLRWYDGGRDPDKYPQFEHNTPSLIVVDAKGLWEYAGSPEPELYGRRAFAFGSGAPVAMGAMLSGKSARQAVLIANEVCLRCGMGVDTMRLKK